MYKKISNLFIFMSIVTLLFIVSSKSVLAVEYSYGDYKYEISDNGVIITKYEGEDTYLEIPDYIDGLPVIKINDKVFQKSEIYSVTFPDTLKEIGSNAFQNCLNLTKLDFSDSIKIIGSSAFSGCKELRTFDLPPYIESIGSNAFSGCENFYTLYVPKSLQTANQAFQKTPISSVEFEMDIETIPAGILFGCSELYEVDIPSSVITIGQDAFNGCISLREIIIPDSVIEIGKTAFKNCEKLYNVKMSKNVITLGRSAFSGCISLTEIDLPNTIQSADSAFEGSGLKIGYIPYGMTLIPKEMFKDATEMESVKIPDTIINIGESAFAGCTSLKTVELPKYVIGIDKSAFEGCSSLYKVELAPFVKTLGKNSFSGCSSLKDINIPKTVTTADLAFSKSGIVTAKLEYGILAIPKGMFSEATKLTSVDIPMTVVSIGDNAFYDCFSLPEINIPENVESIGSAAFYECSKITELVIPNDVTVIESKTFYSCSSLRVITLPMTITSIGASAFEECGALVSFETPTSCISIGNKAFMNCDDLTKVTWPYGLTTIGSEAFSGCTSLDYVNLPNSVTSIGKESFAGCTSLRNLTFGIGLSSIPDSAFKHCLVLEEVVLPRYCTKVESSAFAENVKLKKATIFPATTSIQVNSFSYPEQLTIYGAANSYAQIYAAQVVGTITFELLDRPITSLSFDVDKLEFKGTGSNKKKVLPLTIAPIDSSDTITYTVADTKVATVDDFGVVTPKKAGTTSLTVKSSNGKTAKISIVVKSLPTAIAFTKDLVELEVGQTTKLVTTMTPTDADDDLTWTSSNKEVVSVSDKGEITALGIGTVLITVLTSNGKSATCTISAVGPVIMKTSTDGNGAIITTDGAGVSSPTGDVTVWSEDTPIFTIVPAYGYVVKNVFVDGDSVGAVKTYSLYRPRYDRVIYAEFAPVEARMLFDSDSVKVEISSSVALKDLKLIIADYDEDGRLEDIEIKSVSTSLGEVYRTPVKLGVNTKIMLWDELENMRPIWMYEHKIDN